MERSACLKEAYLCKSLIVLILSTHEFIIVSVFNGQLASFRNV